MKLIATHFLLNLLACLGTAVAATAERPPNVIVILADDQGAGDSGLMPRNAFIHTPNLDRLARSGVLFDNAYCSSSMCTPSRAGMLTGKYPSRVGIYDVGDALIGVPRGEKFMSQYFQERGYATAMIGKWHLGGELEDYNYPLSRGFDRFWGFLDSTHDYWKADTGSSLIYGSQSHAPIFDQREEVKEIDYLTREITKQSLAFIEENKDRPFFLYIGHHPPHVPLQAPRDVYDKYAGSGYGGKAKITRAMMDVLDEGIGQLLDELDRLGLRDDTIIVYSTDNGGGEPDAHLNWKLRGGKFTFWEGGIRAAPTIISWPGHLPEGKIFGDPVINIDFLPTLLAASGAEPVGPLDGLNLLPHLREGADPLPPRSLHWCLATAKKEFAIRDGDWKLVSTGGGQGLYNLREDPFELRDVAAAHPETAQRLWNKHLDWIKGNVRSLATPEAKDRAKAMRDPAIEAKDYRYSDTFGGERL
jgi:arylsulfatase A-like enzyme